MRLSPGRRWAILGAALGLTLAAVKWVASDEVVEVQHAQSPRVATSGETPRESEAVPRIDLERLRRTPQESPRADPFAQKSWVVAARRDALAAAPPPPPPAPKAPPLPFTFFGKAVEGGQVTVFLARGENSYAVRAGETLDGTYRVERVDERAVVFTYLPLGTRQELAFGGTE